MRSLIHYILFSLLMPAATAAAQTLAVSQVQIAHPSILISNNGEIMIGMDITLPADVQLSSNHVATLTPVLKAENNNHNKVLPAVWVYGRTRSIIQQRERSTPTDAYTILRRKNGTEQTVNYSVRLPYEEWMNGAELELMADVHGCADCLKEESNTFVVRAHLERYTVKPVPAFLSPAVEEVKNRAEEGRAFLDFPVNQTKIYPDYRRNPSELAKIKATVDVVRNDANTTITEIDITGYASPEGRYAANGRLAQGRAEALKQYVMNEYGFKNDLFRVNSVPEDWAGLRDYVSQSSLPQKEKILYIIDKEESNFDLKEGRIKALDNGTVYSTLLKDCYPALRHSDYTVRYVVRGFNAEEAKQIIKTRPQQLSLQEMYLAAQTYEKGSKEFNEVFEVAVRMFPEDPTANVNAAAIELQKGDLQRAARYLEKADAQAGTTLNNKGVLMLLQGNLDEAETYFKQAQSLGSTEAGDNLKEVVNKRKDDKLFER